MEVEEAYLYNKHNKLLKVDIKDGRVLKIKTYVEKNQHLLPIKLQGEGALTLETINEWLSRRRMPEDREGLKRAREWFPGFENYKNLFSLTDQYWFRYKKSETWDALNFFTNPYPQEQGKIFFEPWAVKEVSSVQTPDLTTNGVLKKRWIQDKDLNSWLIKAGSVMYHQEPLSEVLASMMLKKLNIIPYVEYDLITHGLQFCSKCQNFITENTEFVPASHIYKKKERPMKKSAIDHFVDMCAEYRIVGAKEFITKMIAADYIICNNDRHLGNFGFIRDVETGNILGFAPIFDFGKAYLGVNPDNIEKVSKLFENSEVAASFKKVMKHIESENLLDNKEMEALIEDYPGLSDKQRDFILYRLKKVEKEIEKEKMPKSISR